MSDTDWLRAWQCPDAVLRLQNYDVDHAPPMHLRALERTLADLAGVQGSGRSCEQALSGRGQQGMRVLCRRPRGIVQLPYGLVVLVDWVLWVREYNYICNRIVNPLRCTLSEIHRLLPGLRHTQVSSSPPPT